MNEKLTPEDLPSISPGTKIAGRRCPECGKKINLPVEYFGKLIRCPFCQKSILIKKPLSGLKDAGIFTGGCLALVLYVAISLFVTGLIVIIAVNFSQYVLSWFGK